MLHSTILALKIALSLSYYAPVTQITSIPYLYEENLVIYLKDFKTELEAKGIQVDYSYLRIRIADELAEEALGQSFYVIGFKRAWILLKPDYSRATVYHELGHALFHLMHIPGDDSIMNEASVQGKLNKKHMDEFIQQIQDSRK